MPRGKIVIQSTDDPSDLDNEYAINHAVVGDAKLVLRGLIDEIRGRGGNGRDGVGIAAEVQSVKSAWMDEWMPHLTSEETPINPYRVVWELRNTIDRTNAIVTHDSGNPRDQMVPFFETIAHKSYLGWGNSTQLGTGLGMALGAKCAAPEKLVINVMGDTAAGTVLLDVETAVRERLPILTCILNNGAMGGYEHNIPIAVERYGSKFLTGDYSRHRGGPRRLHRASHRPQRRQRRHHPRHRPHRGRPDRRPGVRHQGVPGVLPGVGGAANRSEVRRLWCRRHWRWPSLL